MTRDESGVRACRKSNIEFFSNFKAEEAGRRHSEHLGGTVKNDDIASNDRVLAAKLVLPKRVANDHAECSAARLVISWCEQPASNGNNSEYGKGLSAHPKALDQPLLISLSDQRWAGEPGEKSGKSPLLCSDLLPQRCANRRFVLSQPEVLKSALDLHPDQ